MSKICQITYRGSLSSCNYKCAYCPFSKHTQGAGVNELAADKKHLQRFIRRVGESGFCGGVQIAPHGEALIHRYYWEGMAQLSRLPGVKAVGAQSNFSFCVEEMLPVFSETGGKIEKLRLWGTFHPAMTVAEVFTDTCRRLRERGVSLCVGAVAVPEELPVFQKFRKELPEEITMWFNAMDGLERGYTPEEQRAFQTMDPYFERSCHPPAADSRWCTGHLFVRSTGEVTSCNLCRIPRGNFYEASLEELAASVQICHRKRCDCYLASSIREDLPEYAWFGPYSMFRIPSA